VTVGTGIVNVYTRGAALTAISFLSLNEIAPGRIIMGLGAGSPLVLKPQGVAFHKPLTRLRETIDVVQALLRGERVAFAGETISVDGAQLEVTPASERIPLYLGVTGPKALELAGEKADGVMLNCFLPTRYVPRALSRIELGARRAARALRDLDITGGVVVSVDDDPTLARDRSRRFIGLYLSLFPNLARETELPDDLIQAARSAFGKGGAEAAAAHIDDRVVDYLTASGTPADCRRKIDEYRAAGLQMPILFPLEPNVRMSIDTLGPSAA
jgi:5,10-methylenetetrahydromethanopterin reductase